MSTVKAAVGGHAPTVLVQPVQPDYEQLKYEKMWKIKWYRNYSPGEKVAHIFLKQANIQPDDEVIDFGTGTGRGALMLALFGRAKVTMVDFAVNCLDDDVRSALRTQHTRLNFVQADLRRSIPVNAKYGYCTDVMEHIPPADVDATLINVMKAAQHVFFQICLVDDHFGAHIGEKLHLTVQPYQWWLNKFVALGAVVHWSSDDGSTAMFYVSAWNDASELVKNGVINVGNELIRDNIRSSIKRELMTLRPYDKQDTTVMVLAGGPSLDEFKDEIIAKRLAGIVLVTVNGAYNWAIENGLFPSAQIIVDAQEHNKRFVAPLVSGCKYMIASQCHPVVFDALPPEQTLLWHSAIEPEVSKELDEHYSAKGEAWYPSIGGSTVMLRALPLLRMLGYYKFEIYGFDSCMQGDKHHAYTQEENDGDSNPARLVKVTCGSEVFSCTSWQASQAQEFMDLIHVIGDEVELDVAGTGLISSIIKEGASAFINEVPPEAS